MQISSYGIEMLTTSVITIKVSCYSIWPESTKWFKIDDIFSWFSIQLWNITWKWLVKLKFSTLVELYMWNTWEVICLKLKLLVVMKTGCFNLTCHCVNWRKEDSTCPCNYCCTRLILWHKAIRNSERYSRCVRCSGIPRINKPKQFAWKINKNKFFPFSQSFLHEKGKFDQRTSS